jgi:hypothetical protein
MRKMLDCDWKSCFYWFEEPDKQGDQNTRRCHRVSGFDRKWVLAWCDHGFRKPKEGIEKYKGVPRTRLDPDINVILPDVN